jgi:molybdopterin-guanine dinucleotide biosynthesis protein A
MANSPAHSATLAILAGGVGSRMGIPKALLQIDQKPILQWLLDRLHWPGRTMLVTAPAVLHLPGCDLFDQHAIDPLDGQGPLRGILTALQNLSTETVVVIPVDMPHIEPAHLYWILDSLVARPELLGVMCRPKSATHIEPFPSAFRAAAREPIDTRLGSDLRSVVQLCADPRFAALDTPADWGDDVWMNLNDPASLRTFESSRSAAHPKERQ